MVDEYFIISTEPIPSFRDAPFDIQGGGVRKFKKKKSPSKRERRKKFTHEVGKKKIIHPPSGKKSTLGVYRKKKIHPQRRREKKITSQPVKKEKNSPPNQTS